MISPVICLCLYRRPEYTRQLLERLSACYGVEQIPIYISCDYDETYKFQCDEVYVIAREFIMSRNNPKDAIFRNNPKQGIDLNKIFVIPKAFEVGNYIIFLEDDTPVSTDAPQYFLAMGEMYEDDKSVLSVTAYNRITDESEFRAARESFTYHVGRRAGFIPWTWAMWKDRWDEFYSNGAQQYKSDTKEEANGLFDHWLHAKGKSYIYPLLPRANHAAWENAEHTPSKKFLMENEFSPFGAWNEEMPDATGANWHESAVENARDDSGIYAGGLGSLAL